MTRALPLLAAAWLVAAPLAAPAQDARERPLPDHEFERGDPIFPPPETWEGVADILRESLARLGARLGPWREQLAGVLANPGAYEAPVILPNGDILIRRRPEADAGTPPRAEPEAPSPEPGAAVDL